MKIRKKWKKTVSLLLAFCLVMGLLPTTKAFAASMEVGTETELVNALGQAQDGDTITLCNDIEVNQQLVINACITLDLGGYMLTNNYANVDGTGIYRFTLITTADVTIQNGAYEVTAEAKNANGVETRGIVASEGNLTLSSMTATAYGINVCTYAEGGTLTILDSGIFGSYAVGSFANDNTVIIDGSSLAGTVCGLYHNGSYYGFECYVSDTTIIGADSGTGNAADEDAAGVYISGSTATEAAAGCHTAIFTDCAISGATGIEVKYTNLTLSNCTVNAMETAPTFEQYNNGTTTSGFAVVSTDNSMSGDDPQPSGTITISGGTYTGLVGLSEFADTSSYSGFKEATYVISGGNFTTQIPAGYCAEGYISTTTRNAEGYYTVEIITYTLNVAAVTFGDVAYGYTQPDAESITITSTGNSDATISSVTVDSTNFIISGNGDTVTAGGAIETWTIQPAANLAAETYSDTITVIYNGGATAEGKVSFTVNRADQSIFYSDDSVSRHINDAAFINTLTQTAGDGTISYASSDTDIATVDENTGKVTIVSTGTATITATAAATENYNEATASYMLTVTDHNYKSEVVAPTYTNQGYTLYTCTICGDSYKTDYTDILVLDGTDGSVSTKTTVQELTAVPEGLKNLYSSVDALISDLIKRVIAVGTGYTADNTLVYDVVLQYSTDGGATWITATVDNFPTTGITVTLPYPNGTDASYEFTVLHMFTETSSRLGITAGGTETPTVTKTADGLAVTLTGLSPVALSWKEGTVTANTTTEDEPTVSETIETETSDTSSQTDETASTETSATSASSTTAAPTSDNSHMALWFVLLLISGIGVVTAIVFHRRKKAR